MNRALVSSETHPFSSTESWRSRSIRRIAWARRSSSADVRPGSGRGIAFAGGLVPVVDTWRPQFPAHYGRARLRAQMAGVAGGPANANVSVGVFEEFWVAAKQLAGQVALVTGVNKRIGRSISLRLAAEGASVAVNYRGAKQDADAVVREIVAAGGKAAAFQADVTKRAEVERLFAAAAKEFGRLDILVNNAGEFFAAKFEELTDEQWDGILDINLKSQFLCAQAAAKIMKRQGRGRIV